jgi:hypothetical protein
MIQLFELTDQAFVKHVINCTPHAIIRPDRAYRLRSKSEYTSADWWMIIHDLADWVEFGGRRFMSGGTTRINPKAMELIYECSIRRCVAEMRETGYAIS